MTDNDYSLFMFVCLVVALCAMIYVKTRLNRPQQSQLPHAKQPVVSQQTIVEPRVDARWLTMVAKDAYHVLIVGETGSGKSTFAKALLVLRSKIGKVIVLDPHAGPSDWGVAVTGMGRNYVAINNAISAILAELNNRYKIRSSGHCSFEPLTIFVDEFPAIVKSQDCNLARTFLTTLVYEGRKVNINLVILAQSDKVKALGLEGEGDSRNGFCFALLGTRARACLPSHFTNEGKAIVIQQGDTALPADAEVIAKLAKEQVSANAIWQPNAEKHLSPQEAIKLISSVSPPVSPTQETDFEPTEPDLEETAMGNGNGKREGNGRETGLETLIKFCVLGGLSQHQTIKLLRGKTETIAATWRRIKQELEN